VQRGEFTYEKSEVCAAETSGIRSILLLKPGKETRTSSANGQFSGENWNEKPRLLDENRGLFSAQVPAGSFVNERLQESWIARSTSPKIKTFFMQTKACQKN